MLWRRRDPAKLRFNGDQNVRVRGVRDIRVMPKSLQHMMRDAEREEKGNSLSRKQVERGHRRKKFQKSQQSAAIICGFKDLEDLEKDIFNVVDIQRRRGLHERLIKQTCTGKKLVEAPELRLYHRKRLQDVESCTISLNALLKEESYMEEFRKNSRVEA